MTPEDKYAEDLLSARIALDREVSIHQAGWRERYCRVIDKVAGRYNVKAVDLTREFMVYNGATVMAPTGSATR